MTCYFRGFLIMNALLIWIYFGGGQTQMKIQYAQINFNLFGDLSLYLGSFQMNFLSQAFWKVIKLNFPTFSLLIIISSLASVITRPKWPSTNYFKKNKLCFIWTLIERTSFMDVIRSFMEVIRAFMEIIRAFMENNSNDVHLCAKCIGYIGKRVL
jgi:hypothetical protein